MNSYLRVPSVPKVVLIPESIFELLLTTELFIFSNKGKKIHSLTI